jgi:hypothetical protein
MMENEF